MKTMMKSLWLLTLTVLLATNYACNGTTTAPANTTTITCERSDVATVLDGTDIYQNFSTFTTLNIEGVPTNDIEVNVREAGFDNAEGTVITLTNPVNGEILPSNFITPTNGQGQVNIDVQCKVNLLIEGQTCGVTLSAGGVSTAEQCVFTIDATAGTT